MQEIQIPFAITGIPLKPELSGRQKLEETIVQSLSAIMGYDGSSRRLLTCALNGSLHTISPTIDSIINILGSGVNDDITFSSTPTSEIMIQAHSGNTGYVWINVGAAAAVDIGWPLFSGSIVGFSINNLKDLQIRIVTDGDRVIIIRSV